MKLEIIEGVDRLHEDLWSKIVNVSINSEGENSPKNILFGVQKDFIRELYKWVSNIQIKKTLQDGVGVYNGQRIYFQYNIDGILFRFDFDVHSTKLTYDSNIMTKPNIKIKLKYCYDTSC